MWPYAMARDPWPSKVQVTERHRTQSWGGISQSVQRLAMGWTVRGSNPGGGRDFPQPSRPVLGPTQPPIQCVPGLFPGVKRPSRGVDHPPLCSAKAKERVELYLYSISGSSWPVIG